MSNLITETVAVESSQALDSINQARSKTLGQNSPMQHQIKRSALHAGEELTSHNKRNSGSETQPFTAYEEHSSSMELIMNSSYHSISGEQLKVDLKTGGIRKAINTSKSTSQNLRS